VPSSKLLIIIFFYLASLLTIMKYCWGDYSFTQSQFNVFKNKNVAKKLKKTFINVYYNYAYYNIIILDIVKVRRPKSHLTFLQRDQTQWRRHGGLAPQSKSEKMVKFFCFFLLLFADPGPLWGFRTHRPHTPQPIIQLLFSL